MSCTPKNRLTIARPTAQDIANCGSGNLNCPELGPIDCVQGEIGPRPHRENVRQQLHDYVLLKLGAPVIEIELDEQQVDLAVDEALQIFEDYAPREFYQYYTFPTVPGKSVYQLPPDVGYVRDIFYRETAQYAFQASDLDGVIPIEYFYQGGAFGGGSSGMIDPTMPMWSRMGEWTLYKQYENMFSRLSSNLGGWEWIGGYNTIKLYPIPCKPAMAICHYLEKNPDWKCTMQVMQEGALCFAMAMLGEIRSKFSTIPNPGGGVTLNGADLVQRAEQLKDKWYERLISRYSDIPPFSMG